MSRYMNYDSTSTPKAATLDNLELSTKLMLEAADEIDRLEQRIRELESALRMVLDDPDSLSGRPRTLEVVMEALEPPR